MSSSAVVGVAGFTEPIVFLHVVYPWDGHRHVATDRFPTVSWYSVFDIPQPADVPVGVPCAHAPWSTSFEHHFEHPQRFIVVPSPVFNKDDGPFVGYLLRATVDEENYEYGPVDAPSFDHVSTKTYVFQGGDRTLSLESTVGYRDGGGSMCHNSFFAVNAPEDTSDAEVLEAFKVYHSAFRAAVNQELAFEAETNVYAFQPSDDLPDFDADSGVGGGFGAADPSDFFGDPVYR